MDVVGAHAPKRAVGICATKIGIVAGAFGSCPKNLLGIEISPVVHEFVAGIMAIEVVRHQNQMFTRQHFELASD